MIRHVLGLLGAVGTGTVAGLTGAVVLLGWMTPIPLHAAEGPLADFFGTYVGVAEVEALEGGEGERRHLDIVIEPYDDDGFRLNWVNVTLVDGRRDVAGVERRVQDVLFEPAANGDFFVEAEEENPFRERAAMQPMEGDPVRWATVQDGDLIVYSFVVHDDGRYELQIYERRLTEDGMEIEFQRLLDGELQRRITGHAVRANTKRGD